jgi:hypothetical protein
MTNLPFSTIDFSNGNFNMTVFCQKLCPGPKRGRFRFFGDVYKICLKALSQCLVFGIDYHFPIYFGVSIIISRLSKLIIK